MNKWFKFEISFTFCSLKGLVSAIYHSSYRAFKKGIRPVGWPLECFPHSKITWEANRRWFGSWHGGNGSAVIDANLRIVEGLVFQRRAWSPDYRLIPVPLLEINLWRNFELWVTWWQQANEFAYKNDILWSVIIIFCSLWKNWTNGQRMISYGTWVTKAVVSHPIYIPLHSSCRNCPVLNINQNIWAIALLSVRIPNGRNGLMQWSVRSKIFMMLHRLWCRFEFC